MRRIATESGFEHAGGTPPPPPLDNDFKQIIEARVSFIKSESDFFFKSTFYGIHVRPLLELVLVKIIIKND